MLTLVIDYGMGNLGSVKRALEECGAKVAISNDPRKLGSADRLVLPGVGAFANGMVNLKERGLIESIRKAVLLDKIPILGICLGMQLMADRGFEVEEMDGLGLMPGEVTRLVADSSDVRIPHVGWNEVNHDCTHPLLAGIPDGTDFYFVHSYHLIPNDPVHSIGTTPFCGRFTSVAASGAMGVQFHPEKSGQPGFQLLKNFLRN